MRQVTAFEPMNCELCGQAVEVYSSSEGTNSYVGVEARRVKELEHEKAEFSKAFLALKMKIKGLQDQLTLGVELIKNEERPCLRYKDPCGECKNCEATRIVRRILSRLTPAQTEEK